MNADLAPGAHLSTRRRGYTHHGLYAGDGRVIHYAGFHRFMRRGPVEEVTLEQFARGRGWQVEPGTPARFEGARAVERARRRLGEDRYRLWTNNCEHFVQWCLSGTPRSPQVEAWTAPVRRPWSALRGLLGRPGLRSPRPGPAQAATPA